MKTSLQEQRASKVWRRIALPMCIAGVLQLVSAYSFAQGKMLVDSRDGLNVYRIASSGGRYRISFEMRGRDPLLVTYCGVYTIDGLRRLGPEQFIQVGRGFTTTWVNTPDIQIIHTEDMAPRREPAPSSGHY